MPNLSLKYLESLIKTLKEENSDLKRQVESLTSTVGSLETELRSVQFIVSENIERREAVEENLASVEQKCTTLKENQGRLSSAIEIQAQYSRKTTLLLSGRAVPDYREGEPTRAVVIGLLKEYLGIDVHARAITACHRLSNKRVILVRFADLDERMFVYRTRISPLKQGLIIHESLTNERLAVVKILQRLHRPKETSPFLSYYTSMGRIFIRLTNQSDPVELFVGTTEQDILNICGRSPTGGAVSNHADAAHSSLQPGPSVQNESRPGAANHGAQSLAQSRDWQTAGPKKGRSNTRHQAEKQTSGNNSQASPGTSNSSVPSTSGMELTRGVMVDGARPPASAPPPPPSAGHPTAPHNTVNTSAPAPTHTTPSIPSTSS